MIGVRRIPFFLGRNVRFSSSKKPLTTEEEAESLSDFVKEGSGGSMTNLDDMRQHINSIAKDLFRGKVQTLALSYPNVLPNDRYQELFRKTTKVQLALEDRKELLQKIDSEKHISKDLLLALRSLGYFTKGGLPEEAGGHGLGTTEMARLWEELSVNLSLSESVYNSATYGYGPLLKFGSESQKAKHLPGLLSGEKVGAFCVADDTCGSDISSTSVWAEEEDDGSFIINGTKSWVTNGSTADLFTVFANVKSSNYNRPDQLTAFLVPKDSPGVSVGKRHDMVGLKGIIHEFAIS